METEYVWSGVGYDPCRRATWGEFKHMAEQAGITDDTVIDYIDVRPLVFIGEDGEEPYFGIEVNADGQMIAC